MKRSYNPTTRVATFTFDGDVPPLTLSVDKCSAAIQAEFLGHGIIARVGDKAAISKSDAPGFKVTDAMRRVAMVPVVEHYESGTEDWDMRGGPRAPVFSPQIQAIADKLGKSYAEAQAWFADKLTAELAAM